MEGGESLILNWMKTVANLNSLGEAQTLQLKLGSFGIESFIPDEMGPSITPPIFLSNTGIRLQVAEEDEGEARRVIEDESELDFER